MEKYKIIYKYEENEERWTAVCPELFSFVIYEKTEEDLKKEVVRVLKKYLEDNSISLKNIVFKEETKEMML